MIKSVTITNFQSHRNSELEFDPGLNIIIGKSDSGKTALVRAFHWLIWNRPSGDQFRSKWGGRTAVEIITEEGDILLRSKDDGENLYVLNEREFKAFGTTIPDEIQQALNINEINLQSQFDSPFLLTKSAGEVAVHFNKIAHIDKIDSSIKKVQQAIRGIEQNIKSYKLQITESEEELAEYVDLDKLEAEIEVLEEMQKRSEQMISTKTKLVSLVKQINTQTEEIKVASEILKMELDIDTILALMSEKDQLIIEANEIEEIVSNINNINETIATKNQLVNLEIKIKPILLLFDEIDTLTTDRTIIADILDDINYSFKIQKQAEENLIKLQTKFDKDMGDSCILCGQKIKHNHGH